MGISNANCMEPFNLQSFQGVGWEMWAKQVGMESACVLLAGEHFLYMLLASRATLKGGQTTH